MYICHDLRAIYSNSVGKCYTTFKLKGDILNHSVNHKYKFGCKAEKAFLIKCGSIMCSPLLLDTFSATNRSNLHIHWTGWKSWLASLVSNNRAQEHNSKRSFSRINPCWFLLFITLSRPLQKASEFLRNQNTAT